MDVGIRMGGKMGRKPIQDFFCSVLYFYSAFLGSFLFCVFLTFLLSVVCKVGLERV